MAVITYNPLLGIGDPVQAALLAQATSAPVASPFASQMTSTGLLPMPGIPAQATNLAAAAPVEVVEPTAPVVRRTVALPAEDDGGFGHLDQHAPNAITDISDAPTAPGYEDGMAAFDPGFGRPSGGEWSRDSRGNWRHSEVDHSDVTSSALKMERGDIPGEKTYDPSMAAFDPGFGRPSGGGGFLNNALGMVQDYARDVKDIYNMPVTGSSVAAGVRALLPLASLIVPGAGLLSLLPPGHGGPFGLGYGPNDSLTVGPSGMYAVGNPNMPGAMTYTRGDSLPGEQLSPGWTFNYPGGSQSGNRGATITSVGPEGITVDNTQDVNATMDDWATFDWGGGTTSEDGTSDAAGLGFDDPGDAWF